MSVRSTSRKRSVLREIFCSSRQEREAGLEGPRADPPKRVGCGVASVAEGAGPRYLGRGSGASFIRDPVESSRGLEGDKEPGREAGRGHPLSVWGDELLDGASRPARGRRVGHPPPPGPPLLLLAKGALARFPRGSRHRKDLSLPSRGFFLGKAPWLLQRKTAPLERWPQVRRNGRKRRAERE